MLSIKFPTCKQNEFWKDKIAMVVFAHFPPGFPLIRHLIHIGMKVIGVSRTLHQAECIRSLLGTDERERYYSREIDLHSMLHIDTLIMELIMNMKKVDLLILLIPKVSEHQIHSIHCPCNESLLQTLIEIDDLCASSFKISAGRALVKTGYIWTICFNYNHTEIVVHYIQNQLELGPCAERLINVFLIKSAGNVKKCTQST